MDNRTPPYIDLKRSLNYPHGSLSPRGSQEAENAGWHSRFEPQEPLSRRQQRQDAAEFTGSATWLLVAFIFIAHALFFFFAR